MYLRFANRDIVREFLVSEEMRFSLERIPEGDKVRQYAEHVVFYDTTEIILGREFSELFVSMSICPEGSLRAYVEKHKESQREKK